MPSAKLTFDKKMDTAECAMLTMFFSAFNIDLARVSATEFTVSGKRSNLVAALDAFHNRKWSLAAEKLAETLHRKKEHT